MKPLFNTTGIFTALALAANTVTAHAYSIQKLRNDYHLPPTVQEFPSQLSKNLEILSQAALSACLRKYDEAARRTKPLPGVGKEITTNEGIIECGRYVDEVEDQETKTTHMTNPGCWATSYPNLQSDIPRF